MFIDKLIEGHNWRFQSLRSSPKSRFSWEKMYDLMGFKCPSSFFSSLSDYVHGLSTSNLNLEMEDELFDPVYSFGISLLGKLMSSLKRYFGDGGKGNYVFLVDEAHNLVDRAREYV